MVPIFPHFEPLATHHRHHHAELTSCFPAYSDFNFTSLLCWNTDGVFAYSLLNGNIVIRFSDYITGEIFYSFLGENACEETAHTLLSHMQSEGRDPFLKLLPETSAQHIHSEAFSIQEDPDNFDYILSIDRLKTYAGNDLGPKRNFVNRYKNLYPTSETRLLDLSDPTTQAMVHQCFLGWVEEKNLATEETINEHKALLRAMQFAGEMQLITVGVFIDGVLAGFTVNERLPGVYGMLHFEKAYASKYVGIYQYLAQETARILSEHGCELLNYQQDLGIPGLKKCKKSFSPAHHLKKYTVRWRPN